VRTIKNRNADRTEPYRGSLVRLLPVLAALSAAACGGGGGSGGGGGAAAPTSGTVDVLLTDAPVDELLAFRAEVAGLFLEHSGGQLTANLLSAPVAVELLGLQGVLGWLAHAETPEGTYVGARVAFTPGSYTALDMAGAPVAVSAASDELVVAFPSTVTVGKGSYARLSIDVDLASSLTGDLSAPPIAFQPSGSVSVDSGSSSGAIDEIKGVVTSADEAAQSLVIDAFVDSDLTVPLGAVQVLVSAGTLLLDDDGVAYGSSSAFFAALIPGSTLLEVHGLLGAGGAVQASRIGVEDRSGGSGSSRVKIEGIVVDLTASGLELLIREIEQGTSIAIPVLQGLGNPPSIHVSFDGATNFYFDDDSSSSSGSGTRTDAGSLAVGQEVKVKFFDFIGEPFPAYEIEIEDQHPEYEGHITDTSGLPTSFVMHLSSSEPAVQSGDVASSSTDVLVQLGSGPLFLDTEGEPALTADQLLVGLKVEVHGALSGPPSGPTLAASKTKVHAGRLRKAQVVAISPASSSFSTAGGELHDPFGEGVTAGPLNVLVAPGAVFDDDATSLEQLYALFEGLASGEVLEVEIDGIGSGTPNEILAHEIEARVED